MLEIPETGTPKHFNFKMKYCGETKCPKVPPQRGQNPYDEVSCKSTICDHHDEGSCKIDDTFKVHECAH